MVVGKESSIARIESKLKKWDGKLINAYTDYASGSAVIKIRKNGKDYSFSHTGKNAREALSVLSWSVCRLIDCDIRGILPFEKTAKEYLMLEGSTEPFIEAEEKWFEAMGLTSKSSNFEIMKKYKELAKSFHPDDAPEEAKEEFHKKMAEINEAYSAIKKARRI